MIITVELPEYNVALAFKDAKQEVKNEGYYFDVNITLLNVVMLAGEEQDTYEYTFKAIKV